MNDSILELLALFPFLIYVPVESVSLQDRVQRLEGTVLLLLDEVRSLVEKVEHSLGPEAVGVNLGAIASASSESGAIALVDDIDREIQSGNKSVAVRKVRDEFGCTWDEAIKFVGQWQTIPRKDRIRIIRLSKMMRCHEEVSKQPEQKADHL